MVHPDDLALDLDEHSAERLRVGPALFRRERREPRITAEFVNEPTKRVGRAGEEQVDALLCQQNRALQACIDCPLPQDGTQVLRVVDSGEEVRREVEDGGHRPSVRGG